jgi:hypothetical protein
MQKKRVVKAEKNFDIQAIEDQVTDIMKNAVVPDVENIEVNEAIKKRLDTSDFTELENLEKELGIEDILSRRSSSASADIPVEYMAVEAEDEETAHLEEIETENESAQTEPKERVDGSFELHATEDKMSLLLDLHPSSGGGKSLTSDAVKAKICAMKVVYGVNSELIDRLVASVEQIKEEKKGVIIAQGKPPEEGKDGSIEYKFKESDEVLRSSSEE